MRNIAGAQRSATHHQATERAHLYKRFEREVLALTDDLHRAAFRYTSSRFDAEDLVQETLLKAFKAFDGSAENSYCKSWLMTIMRNIWISNYRCALRRPTETLVAIDSAYEAAFASQTSRQAAPSAEHQALSHEIDADIVEALLTLPKSMRETVYFIGIEGFNCREVAEIMGIARRSAAYRIHQSRKRLRNKLAHYGRPQQPSPQTKN